MPSFKGKKDRLLTGIIITVSIAGILYFGVRAVYENTAGNQDNPFEYDIEHFKKSGADRIQYSEVRRFGIELENPHGIAVGVEDTIYVSGKDSVLILNSEGQAQATIATGETVYCLAADSNQDLYLGMMDRVEIYNRTGAKKAQWDSLGEDAIITSLAVSEEHVFVADAGNFIVWKFDKSGVRQLGIGEKNAALDIPGFVIPSPYFDVALDPDGFLWAVNPGRHSLENYTPDGGLRSFWGEFSMEIEGFCGCCNPSHLAILEDGSFVTSEKGIARVKVYNRLGEFVSVVAGSDQFKEGVEGLDIAIDSNQRIYVLDPLEKAIRVFERNRSEG